MMDNIFDESDPGVVDLGAASVETKGAIGGVDDNIGLLPQTGLSPD